MHNGTESDPQAELSARALAFATTLSEAIVNFPELVADPDPAAGWSAREVLAEQWARQVRIQLESGDDLFSSETNQILGMIESAYTVRALDGPDFEDAETRSLILSEVLTSEESWERVVRVAPGFFPGWWHLLDNLWDEEVTRAGQPARPRPDDWPPVTDAPEHAAETEPGLSKRWLDAAGSLYATAIEFYTSVDPGHNAMTEQDRVRAQVIVRTICVLDRKVDLLYERFAAGAWDGLGIVIRELRALARDLVLQLSSDPERRALGMTRGDVRLRYEVFQLMLAGDTADQAWRKGIEQMRRLRDAQQRR